MTKRVFLVQSRHCGKQQLHSHFSHRHIIENALTLRDTASLMSKIFL